MLIGVIVSPFIGNYELTCARSVAIDIRSKSCLFFPSVGIDRFYRKVPFQIMAAVLLNIVCGK